MTKNIKLGKVAQHNHLTTMLIKRLHPGLFGISLGLISLSGTWHKFTAMNLISDLGIESFLFTAGVLVLLTLTALFIAKLTIDFEGFMKIFHHPAQGPMLAIMPVATSLAIALFIPGHLEYLTMAYGVMAINLLLQLATAWQMVEMLSSGKLPSEFITPALYIPVVPGGLVGGIALNAIGLPGFGYMLWGMGVGAWALLEMRILGHLFKGPLPAVLRPTIGIEMAPGAVSTLTAITLWPNLPVDAVLIGLGFACGPILAVLTRWKSWTDVPFSFGFWSFSFPVAAIASCIIEAVTRGHWPPAAAWLALILANLIIGFLIIRTFLLLLQGKLLPK